MVTSAQGPRAGPHIGCQPIPTGCSSGTLSPNLCYMLVRMWKLGFGMIRGLHIRAGDPVFDPPPQFVRTINCRQQDARSRAPASRDFALKQEQIVFQRALAAIDTGVIDVIKVHDGLPMIIEIQEQL